jgi:large subunit ribosomal protein L5
MKAMQQIKVEKITLNFGSGKDQKKLEKGMTMMKSITGIEPMKTLTTKRIAGWGLRPGLPVGCKTTLRKQKAQDMLKRLLKSKENQLKENNFDESGNIAFGIPEYIDIDGAKYDPKIGIIGLEVAVTLEKPGYRIKRRAIRRKKVGKKHQITKEQAMKFMQDKFNTKVEE